MSLRLFPVVILLMSQGVICYSRWVLRKGHKNYFKDWCIINSQCVFFLSSVISDRKNILWYEVLLNQRFGISLAWSFGVIIKLLKLQKYYLTSIKSTLSSCCYVGNLCCYVGNRCYVGRRIICAKKWDFKMIFHYARPKNRLNYYCRRFFVLRQSKLE